MWHGPGEDDGTWEQRVEWQLDQIRQHALVVAFVVGLVGAAAVIALVAQWASFN